MPEIDPGRNRESDPLALKWFQAEGRTIFVRPQDWEPEADVRSLTGVLLRDQGRTRDMAVLATLGQHHYLTTGHVEALFFTSPRGAQRRMRKLEEWGLVTRWHQMEPPAEKGGWRRHCDVFLLTARGATVLAHYLRSEPRSLIKRAFSAFHYAFHLDHALGTNGFFASLVHASRDLPDQGLYHWLGDDGIRRAFEEGDSDLAPDGYGRYLTEHAEIGFHLEWDTGTEPPQRLRTKARTALRAARGHVLWVAPRPGREQTIRSALERAATEPDESGRVAGFWTTHTGLLRTHGPLGEVWRGLEQDERRSLSTLPGRARGVLQIEDCLGKPGWWEHRPGGTEGM